MKTCMLTTKDNPYNPFDKFDAWLQFDVIKGYNSCGYLARIANVSDRLSDLDYAQEVERAIDEIISIDPFDLYRKVERQEKPKMDPGLVDVLEG